ncbi:thiamine phosphate phosphatase-like protein [Spinacia oleracea]|uniref:Thiamine phosphate phosphatase-like protein n=1 Tax=Spinacia oleracea TaxID=3562 RepID=A0A9R0HXX3_SPIOL|nr:thiamine phosphate phosphatase-like protein [Spinacia oleracea]
MLKRMVIFDFDRTIIDGDSDRWVVTQMGLTPLFDQLASTLPWNSLMNKMMEELHLRGKTIQDIGECLKQMPLHPKIISAIKSAHSMGCELWIVSDANQFFIKTILEQYQLFGFFKEIITNPTSVDNDGRLRIAPYHGFELCPHGCTLCPSNMCKGMILKHIQTSAGEIGIKSTAIYIGDGGGDYCPSLKLGENDHVMPRKKFPLWKHIHGNPSLVKATVHDWSNGEELETTLLRLISAATIELRQSIS